MRADAANAKLQVTKVTTERDALRKSLDSLESGADEREREQRELAALRQKYYRAVEDVETRDSELESKSRELEIVRETLEQLKKVAAASVSGGGGNPADNNNEEGGDGWDCEDAREFTTSCILCFTALFL